MEKCRAIGVAFSRDGLNVAVAYGTFGRPDYSNKVLVWNLPKWGEVTHFGGCTDTVDGLAFSTDGALLACAGSTKERFMGGEVNVWSTRNWKKTLTIEGDDVESIRPLAISPDGKYLATGSACYSSSGTMKKVRLWDANDGKLLKHFAELQADIHGLQFSPDGKLLAVGVAGDRTASMWAIPSARKKWLQRAHAEASNLRVMFSPDGKLLATCGDKNVALWDTASGKSVAVLKGHECDVISIAFSQDGSKLISTAWAEFCVWEIPSGQLMEMQSLPNMYLTGICFTANDSELVGVHSTDGDLRIIQFAIQKLKKTIEPTTAVETKLPRSDREKEFITAVVAEPDNDAPRLAYADWLDELKDPRGEFIRIQCDAAKLESRPKLSTQEKQQRTRLKKQAEKLLEKHFVDWTAPLAGLKLRPGQVEFRRGFLWGLELRDIDVTDDSLKILSNVPELERVDLDGSGVSDNGMRHLNAITNLSAIYVSETGVTVNSLDQLKDLKRLILVYNYKWGNEPIREIEAIKQARNRRFLKLPKEKQRSEALRALNFIISWMPPDERGTYKTISFSQTCASDADLVYLRAIPEVELLDFFECHAVTSRGLEHLRPLTRLRTLRLTESGVTDLAPLQHLTSLEELNLDSLEQLEASSFRHLSALTNLRILEARSCRLTDEVLKHIGECKELRELELIFNEFSEQGLRQLLKLKKLQKLEIDHMDEHRDLIAQILGKLLPKQRRQT